MFTSSRRFVVLFCLVCFFLMNQTYAATNKKAGPLGLGVIFGNPTALTGKYISSSNLAYDFGLAFSVSDYILVYADHLVPLQGGFGNKTKFISQLIPYYGVGGIFVVTTSDRSSNDRVLGKKSGSVGLGLRIPLGIEWRPQDPNFGFFVEIVPGISIIPETSAMFQGGLGLRYYF